MAMPPKADDKPNPAQPAKPVEPPKPAAPLAPRVLVNPTRTLGSEEEYLDCQKGDLVRLLVPIYDGVQRISEDTEIHWPYEIPPLTRVAVHAGTKETPLDAPAMTDGKPKANYIDPTTGEKPVIESA